jgi:bifunctional non-homologous end joining protein LigD
VPVLATEPPSGPEWLHEVKHDGWRAQLHVIDGKATIYSKSGADLTRRFKEIAHAVERLPVDMAILDAELTACDDSGLPNFFALMRGAKHGLCAWCFDLLCLDGKDLRPTGCEARRALLKALLGTERPYLPFSDDFEDPLPVLKAADRMNPEGIVSKRRDQPYRSGRNRGWVKVKTSAWRAANRERYKLFEKPP